MKKLTTTAPKVWAKYKDEHLTFGSTVYLPDDADENDWTEFNNIEAAKEQFGIEDSAVKPDILARLRMKQNKEGSI